MKDEQDAGAGRNPEAAFRVDPYWRHWLVVTLAGLGLAVTVMPAKGDFTNINAGLPGVVYGSTAWGDYDNDGHLDLLLLGSTGTTFNDLGIAQIWRNLGDGTFTNANLGLPGVGVSSAAWGDYDNDGWLDILLAGNTPTGIIAQVWRNLGDGTFTNINASLPGVALTAAAWGDFDNDGRLDILLTGRSATGDISRIYRNVGDGFFTDIQAGLLGVETGSVAWGDYDNDGWLDVHLTGNVNIPFVRTNLVWRNLGNGTFTNINAGLPGVGGGGGVPLSYCTSSAWGDCDNDGLLDILFAGIGKAEVWRNSGNGTFTNFNAGLRPKQGAAVAWGDFDNDGMLGICHAGIIRGSPHEQILRNVGDGTFTPAFLGDSDYGAGSVAWGDFDNDGRLDLIITGLRGPEVSEVWRNLGAPSNTAPSSPSGLSATASGNGVVLSWGAASDTETPALGLTYNVRVGTTPGGCDVLSPHSDSATGFRRVAAMGNAQMRRFTILTNLASGCYYWSVQAVDTAFSGGPFAVEGRFSIGLPPIADASATLLTHISANGTNATVILDGSRSFDPDGDLLQYAWYEADAGSPLASGVVAITVLPVGTHPIRLVVTDCIDSATNIITVEVMTAAQAVERLVELASADAPHPQPLLATLAAAIASIDRSNPTSAINQLQAFQNQVTAQVAPLDAELAATFIQAAQEVIDVLSGNNTNPGRQLGRLGTPTRQPNGKVQMQFSAEPGNPYVIEASTNLTDWEMIGVAVSPAGEGTEFEDTQAARFSRRFYRTHLPQPAP